MTPQEPVGRRRESLIPPSALPLARALLLGLGLMIAWLLWSGLFKPLLISLGVLSCGVTIYVLQRMGYFGNETFAFRYSPRLVGFWGWLGKEIVISSIQVSRIVLSRKISVEPRIVKLDVSELDMLDQAVLGNSITLTPGTLTLDVFDDEITVHALTADGAAALEHGEMLRRVAALKDD